MVMSGRKEERGEEFGKVYRTLGEWSRRKRRNKEENKPLIKMN